MGKLASLFARKCVIFKLVSSINLNHLPHSFDEYKSAVGTFSKASRARVKNIFSSQFFSLQGNASGLVLSVMRLQPHEYRIMSLIFQSIYLIYTTSQMKIFIIHVFRVSSNHIIYEVAHSFDLCQ